MDKFTAFIKDLAQMGGGALSAVLNFLSTEVGTICAFSLVLLGFYGTVHYSGIKDLPTDRWQAIINYCRDVGTAGLAAGTWARRQNGGGK
jgi:hypothetical protein